MSKAQKREHDKKQRMILKDRELIENIDSVKKWIQIYCNQEFFIQLLDVDNERYLNDFSYLIMDNSNSSNEDIEMIRNYNQFIKISILLLMKGKLESKSQIYGIYWKSENLLSLVWKIIFDVLKEQVSFFEFKSFIELFEDEVKKRPEFTDPSYVYLPREVYVECLMKVFYEKFYPNATVKQKKWKHIV